MTNFTLLSETNRWYTSLLQSLNLEIAKKGSEVTDIYIRNGFFAVVPNYYYKLNKEDRIRVSMLNQDIENLHTQWLSLNKEFLKVMSQEDNKAPWNIGIPLLSL